MSEVTLEIQEQVVVEQSTAQYRQDMAVIDTFEYLADNPMLAVDLAVGVIGIESSVVGVAATVGAITVPVAGQVAIGVVGIACGIWGVGRTLSVTWDGS